MAEQHVRLEGSRYAAQDIMPDYMRASLSTMELETYRDFLIKGLVVRLNRQVYGHRLAEWDLEVRVPKNWWQHLRKTVGLKFESWPVKGRVVRRRIYPNLPVLPHDKAGISFIVEDRG